MHDEDLTGAWVIWAIVIAVGIPLILVILTELLAALTRRRSAAAGPVRLLRNWVLPAVAVLAFLIFALSQPADRVGVRLVATVLGFLVIVLVLDIVNAAMFASAKAGTWRSRVPAIFVSIVRVLLILVGLALIFSWVWGADVGGFFTALGVTSIVIGLALQNAVGGVISGLLLLFEQPFAIGDWLDTGSMRGRVTDVNWRAVHLETTSGTKIVPNALLAGSAFTNLSRPVGGYHERIELQFADAADPVAVVGLLESVAAELPMLAPGALPVARVAGPGTFTVDLPLRSPSVVSEAISQLHTWLWFASRRAGLALKGAPADGFSTPDRVADAVARVRGALHFNDDELAEVTAVASLEQYAPGEVVQRVGTTPGHLRIVVSGRLQLWTMAADTRIDVAAAETGEYVGHTAVTREHAFVGATAIEPTTMLAVPRAVLDDAIAARPELARSFGRVFEKKRQLVERAVAEAGIAR